MSCVSPPRLTPYGTPPCVLLNELREPPHGTNSAHHSPCHPCTLLTAACALCVLLQASCCTRARPNACSMPPSCANARPTQRTHSFSHCMQQPTLFSLMAPHCVSVCLCVCLTDGAALCLCACAAQVRTHDPPPYHHRRGAASPSRRHRAARARRDSFLPASHADSPRSLAPHASLTPPSRRPHCHTSHADGPDPTLCCTPLPHVPLPTSSPHPTPSGAAPPLPPHRHTATPSHHYHPVRCGSSMRLASLTTSSRSSTSHLRMAYSWTHR